MSNTDTAGNVLAAYPVFHLSVKMTEHGVRRLNQRGSIFGKFADQHISCDLRAGIRSNTKEMIALTELLLRCGLAARQNHSVQHGDLVNANPFSLSYG